jgi:hypothetical protein
MKIIAKTLLASSLCVLMAVPAHAGRYHDDVRLMDRMERQHERIVSGVKSGVLTRKETRKLKKQQRKTRSKARKFHDDNALSKKERRILNRRLVKTSDRIWEFKHNDRDRHTGRYAFRDTCRNANRNYRHHEHDEHYEDDASIVNWVSDSEAWPRYGFLSW